MPNKPRPRCPTCGAAMAPLFRKRVRGETFARAGTTFWCEDHEVIAVGRNDRTQYVTNGPRA